MGVTMVSSMFAEHNLDVIITSISDGHHSEKSLHYTGNAVDIRSRLEGLSFSAAKELAEQINDHLGPDFDFIHEHDHFHLEYQPKRRMS